MHNVVIKRAISETKDFRSRRLSRQKIFAIDSIKYEEFKQDLMIKVDFLITVTTSDNLIIC